MPESAQAVPRDPQFECKSNKSTIAMEKMSSHAAASAFIFVWVVRWTVVKEDSAVPPGQRLIFRQAESPDIGILLQVH